jgi:glycosyltransferase involved in cell wall biosynthesis
MRICCVLGPYLPIPPVRGGAVERIWLSLCGEFAAAGHQVTMISRQFDQFAALETVGGIRHIRLPSRDAPRSRLAYRLFDLVYAGRVALNLPSSDITITNSVALPLILPAERAGRIYVSVARFPKGQMGFYRRAHRLHAVSTAVADAISSQSRSMARRVRVIPNALSTSFTNSRKADRGPREKEILFVGRIAREKGLHLLIRAFSQITGRSDWTLTILGPTETAAGGDGDTFLEDLRKQAGAAGERIRFEKPIFDESELASRLRRAEIFVYPSIAERGESFGMAPLEAMASGCAVVVSGLACFQDFVEPGTNALTFDHTDTSGMPLASVLSTLIHDAALRDALSCRAVETSKHFDSGLIARKFLEDFENLLEENPQGAL